MRQVAKKRLKALSVATAYYCINQTKGTKFLMYIFSPVSLYRDDKSIYVDYRLIGAGYVIAKTRKIDLWSIL